MLCIRFYIHYSFIPHHNFIKYEFFFFAIFWAAPMAYGSFQARGLIGAVATGLRQNHSNAGSELSQPDL